MLLKDEWHPFEIARRLSLWKKAFIEDFEFRHPETRKRLAFELKDQVNTKDLPLFQHLIDSFSTANRVISTLDWGVLAEWHERVEQARTLIEINAFVPENISTAGVDNPLVMQVLERLNEIRSICRNASLNENPNFKEIILFRWEYAPIRHESKYLLVRLEKLLQRPSPSSGMIANT